MKQYLLPLLLITNVSLADTAVMHSDKPEHEWFSQQYNVNGGSCCGLGDGHILEDDEWKNLGDRYIVKINGKWFSLKEWQMRDIAPDKTGNLPLRGTPSTVKKATVWYKYTTTKQEEENEPTIYCFSPWEFLQ